MYNKLIKDKEGPGPSSGSESDLSEQDEEKNSGVPEFPPINFNEDQDDETDGTRYKSLNSQQTGNRDCAPPTRPKNRKVNYDLAIMLETAGGGDKMQLRNRGVTRVPPRRNTRRHSSAGICPLLAKGPNNGLRYVPWSFMDMTTLASKLTPLTDGADKWIEKLEEITGGLQLAGGDIKALLIKTAGRKAALDVFRAAGYDEVGTTHTYDEVSFDNLRTRTWQALREKYPSRMDPAKLEKECLKDSDSPSQFLYNYQRMWKDETGSEWDSNESTKALFMLYVKNAMPKEVQDKLNAVVGLMKMDWPVFSEHIIHYVKAHRAEKQALEDQSKMLANKLTQLQIGELAKQKKERERPKPQAAVSVAAPEEGGPAEGGVMQAPMITPTMSPPHVQQTSTVPNVYPTAPPAGQLQNQQIPPIHVHLNQGGGIQQPAAGRGRGGPPMRGRWRRPQGPSRGPPPGQYQPPPQAASTAPPFQSRLQCWGCGQTGHMQRDCPINPWPEPQHPGSGPPNAGTGPESQNNGPWMGPAAYWQ